VKSAEAVVGGGVNLNRITSLTSADNDQPRPAAPVTSRRKEISLISSDVAQRIFIDAAAGGQATLDH